MSDVDAGQVIGHRSVLVWVDSLGSDQPPLKFYVNYMLLMNKKIQLYKFTMFFVGALCMMAAGYFLIKDEYSTEVKISVAMSAFISTWVIRAIFLTKIDSLRCPNCNNPIMTKMDFPDENFLTLKKYERCYFCGHFFDD